jgi:ATP-dependent Clp protease ATP-binding subunit ClpB
VAETRADLSRAAEIRYAEIPQFEKDLKTEERRLQQLQRSRQILKEVITEEDIATVVSRWTGIPVGNMFADDHAKTLRLEEGLRSRVAGQNEAIHQTVKVMKKAQAGLSDPKKPLGVFLFLGSSGTGKTELSKALAHFQFDSESNLIRMDMSEYGEKHTVSKLLGSPPGYVGSEDGGVLTEAVLKKPYSVVLFDEIEKAHPDVNNIFLQIFDEGRLSDSKGKVVSFKNTVIVMTSNIGSHHILQTQDPVELKELINQSLRSHFRPELLNRIDCTVIFNPLGRESMKSILDIQLAGLYQRLQEREITLTLTDAAKDWLAEMGYNPEYGARPLKRCIENEVVSPLSDAILEGKYPRGSRILCDVRDNHLTYTQE